MCRRLNTEACANTDQTRIKQEAEKASMVPAVQMQNLQRESKFLTVSTCKYVSHLCSSMHPYTCALEQDVRMHKLRPQCASVQTQAMNAVLALYCKHYWEGEGDRADAVFSKVSFLRQDGQCNVFTIQVIHCHSMVCCSQVSADSQEFTLVTNEFGRTMSRAVISQVQRIENKVCPIFLCLLWNDQVRARNIFIVPACIPGMLALTHMCEHDRRFMMLS